MFVRYLPVSFNASKSLATWMDLGAVSLAYPFFNQEISRFVKECDSVAARSTSWEEVISIANLLPPAEPQSIIFHVSRCGSTLLTNLFREIARGIALSEAAPVDSLYRNLIRWISAVDSNEKADLARNMLRALATLYVRLYERPLVIKTHTTSILGIRALRSVWPRTPFVINIREPIEVAVSNLEKPADWLRAMVLPSHAPNVFGFDAATVRTMSMEEYCARGLGEFYRSAIDSLDERCSVIDYSDISPSNIGRIQEALGLTPQTRLGTEAVEKLFATYSKDGTGTRKFADDTLRKRDRVSITARRLIDQWSRVPYLQLLKCRSEDTNRRYAHTGP